MNADESTIEKIALQLIRQTVGLPFEYSESDGQADHMRLVTLGYVYGICEMADALKEALESGQKPAVWEPVTDIKHGKTVQNGMRCSNCGFRTTSASSCCPSCGKEMKWIIQVK